MRTSGRRVPRAWSIVCFLLYSWVIEWIVIKNSKASIDLKLSIQSPKKKLTQKFPPRYSDSLSLDGQGVKTPKWLIISVVVI